MPVLGPNPGMGILHRLLPCLHMRSRQMSVMTYTCKHHGTTYTEQMPCLQCMAGIRAKSEIPAAKKPGKDIEHEGKHLYFIIEPQDPQKVTKTWRVLNKYDDIMLGQVRWFSQWRKYAFYPAPDTIFEEDCMRDISDFCEKETEWHKYTARPMRHG